MTRTKKPIDLAAVRHFRARLRGPLAQSALANVERDEALAASVASTFRRVCSRADELREQGDDVTEAAVSAALEVLGGGRDGR